MIDKARIKRILAREVLLFFLGLGIVGLVWCLCHFRNFYFESRYNSCTRTLKSLQLQLENLPNDYIKEFYEKANKRFVVHYNIGQDRYSVTKDKEMAFLDMARKSKKEIEILPAQTRGFSYIINSDPLNIIENDSSIVFDFVPLSKFREFVSADDYQNKLYDAFANNFDMDERESRNDDSNTDPFKEFGGKVVDSPVEKDPFAEFGAINIVKKTKHRDEKADSGILQLGTRAEFIEKMNIGLNFNSSIVDERESLMDQIVDLKTTIREARNDKLNSFEIRQNVIISILTIGLLLYVLRPSMCLIIWSIKILKQ